MHSNRKEKESSPAPAPSRPGLSPEEKLERKAYYEDQLAQLERLLTDGKKGSKELKGYQELKVHCERKIAEYSKEEVVTV